MLKWSDYVMRIYEKNRGQKTGKRVNLGKHGWINIANEYRLREGRIGGSMHEGL